MTCRHDPVADQTYWPSNIYSYEKSTYFGSYTTMTFSYINYSVCEYTLSTPTLVNSADQAKFDAVFTLSQENKPTFTYTDNTNTIVDKVSTGYVYYTATALVAGLESGTFKMQTVLTFTKEPSLVGQEIILTFTIKVDYCSVSFSSADPTAKLLQYTGSDSLSGRSTNIQQKNTGNYCSLTSFSYANKADDSTPNTDVFTITVSSSSVKV